MAAPLPDKFVVLLKVTKFLTKCKKRGVDVSKQLKDIDPDSTGSVPKVHFQRAVSKLGLNLAADELEALSSVNKNKRRISYHGLITSHTRKLSPVERAELGKEWNETHRKPMTEEEMNFAEQLSVLFNLIDTTPHETIRHSIHRGDILKALKDKSSDAREFASHGHTLKPILHTTSYEASLFAYVTESSKQSKSSGGDDLIDVDEFVDFWFHHVPDHVMNDFEKAKDGFYETHDHHSRPLAKKDQTRPVEDHHEFAVQVRLMYAQHLRTEHHDSTSSHPFILMSTANTEKKFHDDVRSAFPLLRQESSGDGPVAIDHTLVRSSVCGSTLTPMWGDENTFVLLSTGLHNETRPPMMRFKAYDQPLLDEKDEKGERGEDVVETNAVGTLEVVLDRENILDQPSHHPDDAKSLLMKDPNRLSTGVPPNLTLTCGLCRAVVLHVDQVRIRKRKSGDLSKIEEEEESSSSSRVHAEIKIGERGSAWEDKRFFALSRDSSPLESGYQMGPGGGELSKFDFQKCHFVFSLEKWTKPELHVRIYHGSTKTRSSDGATSSTLVGESRVPIDGVPGVHREKDYMLERSSSSSSSSSGRKDSDSVVSLTFRVIARAKFQKNESAHHHQVGKGGRRRSVVIAASKSHGHTAGISMERKRKLAAERIQHRVRCNIQHKKFKDKLRVCLLLSSAWRGHQVRRDILYKAAVDGNHKLLKITVQSTAKERVTRIMTNGGVSPYVARMRWDDLYGTNQSLLHVSARAANGHESTQSNRSLNVLQHLRCCAWLGSTQSVLLRVEDDGGVTGRKAWHLVAARSIQRFIRGFMSRQRELLRGAREGDTVCIQTLLRHGARPWPSMGGNGKNMLHLVVDAGRSLSRSWIVRRQEEDVKGRDEGGKKKKKTFRSLHRCMTFVATRFPEMLLSVDKRGRTPLQCAILLGECKMAESDYDLVFRTAVNHVESPRAAGGGRGGRGGRGGESPREKKERREREERRERRQQQQQQQQQQGSGGRHFAGGSCVTVDTLDPSEPQFDAPTLHHPSTYTFAHLLSRMWPSSLILKDETGATPLDLASACGHTDLVHWLARANPGVILQSALASRARTTEEWSAWWPDNRMSSNKTSSGLLNCCRVGGGGGVGGSGGGGSGGGGVEKSGGLHLLDPDSVRQENRASSSGQDASLAVPTHSPMDYQHASKWTHGDGCGFSVYAGIPDKLLSWELKGEAGINAWRELVNADGVCSEKVGLSLLSRPLASVLKLSYSAPVGKAIQKLMSFEKSFAWSFASTKVSAVDASRSGVSYFEMTIDEIHTAWSLHGSNKKDCVGVPDETSTFVMSIGFSDVEQWEAFNKIKNGTSEFFFFFKCFFYQKSFSHLNAHLVCSFLYIYFSTFSLVNVKVNTWEMFLWSFLQRSPC